MQSAATYTYLASANISSPSQTTESANLPPLLILKETYENLLFSLVIAFSLLISCATAATSPVFSFKLRAEIPFDFMIGKKKFPKGEYTIESVNDGGAMLLRKDKGGKAINFVTIKDKQTDKHKSKLLFRRYGDQYFLARISDGTSQTVFKIEKSGAEKKSPNCSKTNPARMKTKFRLATSKAHNKN